VGDSWAISGIRSVGIILDKERGEVLPRESGSLGTAAFDVGGEE